MTRPLLRFGLPGGIRAIRVERMHEEKHWRMWLAANSGYTQGTYIALCDDGTIQRRHIHPDGTESWFDVVSDGEQDNGE